MKKEVPIKKDKIETLREYVLLRDLKKLYPLYFCAAIGVKCWGQCCLECKEQLGYLKFVKEGDVEEYCKAYNELEGFLDREEGCRLPRHLRSVTCLTHLCKRALALIDDQDRIKGLKALSLIMKELEEALVRIEVSQDDEEPFKLRL